ADFRGRLVFPGQPASATTGNPQPAEEKNGRATFSSRAPIAGMAEPGSGKAPGPDGTLGKGPPGARHTRHAYPFGSLHVSALRVLATPVGKPGSGQHRISAGAAPPVFRRSGDGVS